VNLEDMAVTATTRITPHTQGSLRPMDPARDLGAISKLIDEAFADEIDERGRAAIREMRWMARMSPLVSWWAQADPSFQDAFNGFVWEVPLPGSKGVQIVGNVSLNRAPGSYQRRIICNVVVQKAYQGQGIGRRLTEAALNEAQAKGAEGAILQVYQDNHRAYQLYTDLGFREAAGEVELRLEVPQPVGLVGAPGFQVRAWQPSDGQAAFEVAQLATPSPQHWIRPVRAENYRLGWWVRLRQHVANLWQGKRVYRLVALKEDRLVAMTSVIAAFRRDDHCLEMLVHPDHRGQIERSLASRALYMLSAISPRPIRTTLFKDHKAALRVLRAYGFEEKRTLLTLRQDF
jgi:ribosomal protein S18 acetylase RimI-like enzyme